MTWTWRRGRLGAPQKTAPGCWRSADSHGPWRREKTLLDDAGGGARTALHPCPSQKVHRFSTDQFFSNTTVRFLLCPVCILAACLPFIIYSRIVWSEVAVGRTDHSPANARETTGFRMEAGLSNAVPPAALANFTDFTNVTNATNFTEATNSVFLAEYPYELAWESYKGECFRKAADLEGYEAQATAQVECFSKLLNVTDVPSRYDFENDTVLYQNLGCLLANVTYEDRFRFPGIYHYCTVPEKSYDVFLFVSLGLLAACFLFGKLSTVWVLITGCLLATLNYFVNLLEIGNAIALWVGVQPPELFLFAFLPPLIVEQAIRIDFYLFKKNFVKSLMLAVVMVILTTIILTPIILFVLDFDGNGWTWVYAGLFAAVISPTDALAVASVLKKSNGPALLTNLLESESLLNDATGITLFQIFFKIIRDPNIPSNSPSVWSVIPTIIKDIVVLTSIGFGLGLGFSIVALYSLKWLRWRGAGNYIEATFVLAMSYLVYWVTELADGSGVIAVVTFGLFGNATLLWGMTGSAFKSGDFEAMWDLISFLANGLVFFWAGIASVSFLIPAITDVPKSGLVYASVVIIYLFMLIIRTGCVAMFNLLFHLMKSPLSAAEILFIGWCGLRGAVSLILLATISTGSRTFNVASIPLGLEDRLFEGGVDQDPSYRDSVSIKSDIALWTTSFVILTLVVNGPLIAPLMKSFGLTKISRAASKVQARAKRKILEHTVTCISKYQDDESVAFLTGADWLIVNKYVDLEPALRKFGRVKARKSYKERIVDPTSYLSVLKAFCVTCWLWVKHILHELALLLRLRFGAMNWTDADMYETGSVYEEDIDGNDGTDDGGPGGGGETGGDADAPNGAVDRQHDTDAEIPSSDSDSDYDGGVFDNECHFQAIERTLTRQLSMATIDLEHGLSNLSFLKTPGTGGPRVSVDSHDSNEGSQSSFHARTTRTTEEINQVCLSGVAGQMLLRELKASQATNDAETIPEEGSSDFSGESPRSARYYSSLPAKAGAELYEGLKETLERTRSTMMSPMTLDDDAGGDNNLHGGQDVQADTRKSRISVLESSTSSVATARKADTARPTIRDLSDIFSGVSESEPVSPLSPASPRSSNSPRESALSRRASTMVYQRTGTDSTGPSNSADLSPRPSTLPSQPSRPTHLKYAYTVSGASAKQLQDELQKAEEIRRMYRPSISGRKRDLLGKKGAFSPTEAHLGRDFNISKDGGDVSRHLARRSNLHQLKQEALAKSGSGRLKPVGDGEGSRAISKMADGIGECIIPEEMPKTFSDMADGNGVNGASDADQEVAAITAEEHEENLHEIRARVIAGLKQRFIKRRAEGKISLEAFQILDQTCQEQIEARGPLQLWTALERKAQGGLFIQLSYKAAFSAGKWFKQQRRWLQKLLHYPWEGVTTLFRKNVGRTVLIGCEVAIEYTLALAVSQHVRWLKLHDEYFARLLDEVNEEAEKSHAFIIDREIEAPDTFRAIQSYRAAIIVLKDIQAYVETLMEVGVVSYVESEHINVHIDDKLRKLELTGPVWRPARFSDIMKSLRPFIGLDAKTIDWLWNMGLFQEYMPGQAFFQEDTPGSDGLSNDANTGIFHVLSGVAKKLVYSQDDGTLIKEEYLGVGSCFGVRRALGLATGRRATVVYATGNALGRGTVVFRLMQKDVEKILALSKSGSPIMHEIITRWTKVAALNILDGSEDTLALQLETVLSHNSMGPGSPSGMDTGGHHHHEAGKTHRYHQRTVSLSDVLTSETFLDLDGSNDHDRAVPQKVIRARAFSMAKEITTRLRRGFLASEVQHLLRGDTIHQTTTIVLLKGKLEMQGGGSVEAPAILPQLTEEEEEALKSLAEDGDTPSKRKMSRTTESAERCATWTVSSLTAYVLVFPE